MAPGAPPSTVQVLQSNVAEERPHRLRAVFCHELEDQEHLDHRGEPFQVMCEQDVE
jgi:hypothetical protein